MNIFVEASIGAGKSYLQNNIAAKFKDCENMKYIEIMKVTGCSQWILLT